MERGEERGDARRRRRATNNINTLCVAVLSIAIIYNVMHMPLI